MKSLLYFQHPIHTFDTILLHKKAEPPLLGQSRCSQFKINDLFIRFPVPSLQKYPDPPKLPVFFTHKAVLSLFGTYIVSKAYIRQPRISLRVEKTTILHPVSLFEQAETLLEAKLPAGAALKFISSTIHETTLEKVKNTQYKNRQIKSLN